MRHGVLIVGLGQIGMGYDLTLDPRTHVYSHARAFSLHPGFDLVGAVDPDARHRRIFAEAYGCPAYDRLDDALSRHQPALVVIAVPTDAHADIMHAVLCQSLPKAILCEKPLAKDLADARRMVAACDTKHIALWVNYMRRSDSGAIEIRRRILAGEFGSSVKAVVWYSKGFRHNGSHFVNLLEYWLGRATGWSIIRAARIRDDGDSTPDVWMTFGRGSAVFLAAEENPFSYHTVELVSPKGRLRYDLGGRLIEWQSAVPSGEFAGQAVLAPSETIACGMDRYQWHVADQIARAFNGLDAQLCSGAEALGTLETVQLILRRP